MAYKRKCTDEEIANNAKANGKLGGRPPKYKTAEDLDKAISEYFKFCEDNNKLPTWAMMCIILEISEDTLLNYRSKEEYINSGYSAAIKKAEHLHCHFWQEYATEHPNLQAFCIFELKQPHNGGFRDKPADDTSALGKIEVSIKMLE